MSAAWGSDHEEVWPWRDDQETAKKEDLEQILIMEAVFLKLGALPTAAAETNETLRDGEVSHP